MLLRIGEVDSLIYYRGAWLKSLDKFSLTQDSSVVVLLHGYGANAMDLSSIANYFHSQPSRNTKDIAWFFPQGILSLSGGFFESGQRAWFPISVDRLMRQKMGDSDVLSKEIIEGADDLLSKLDSFFSQIRGYGANKLVLGGFSQGGMVAYHLLPRIISHWQLQCLALFSTVSIEFSRYDKMWKEHLSNQSLKYLVFSHGKRDDILPYQEGKNLFSYLSSYFQQSDFLPFDDGHTIPDDVIQTFFKHL
jgi:phospholipase/carboxylesterase